MKTYKNLYEKICAFDNLVFAAKKAHRGKRHRPNIAAFDFRLEKELLGLRAELISQTYHPGRYRAFNILEPKKRLISAADYRDRVVHHALCNLIEPIFNRSFIFDSYANRQGKGTHSAIQRFQEYAQKYRFVLKCDIKKYFPSVDHEILKGLIRKKVACRKTLWLIDTIIDNSNKQELVTDYFPGDDLFTPLVRRKGLPLGNLTSQFFANIYLDGLDHFCKEQLKIKGYLRYVDDFVIFADRKAGLWSMLMEIRNYLESIRLVLNRNKTMAYPVTEGVEFLGHKVFPEFRRLKRDNVIRFRKHLKYWREQYQKGIFILDDLTRRIKGWIAHASFSKTYHLRQAVLENFRI